VRVPENHQSEDSRVDDAELLRRLAAMQAGPVLPMVVDDARAAFDRPEAASRTIDLVYDSALDEGAPTDRKPAKGRVLEFRHDDIVISVTVTDDEDGLELQGETNVDLEAVAVWTEDDRIPAEITFGRFVSHDVPHGPVNIRILAQGAAKAEKLNTGWVQL
jgi:hypothetical protein